MSYYLMHFEDVRNIQKKINDEDRKRYKIPKGGDRKFAEEVYSVIMEYTNTGIEIDKDLIPFIKKISPLDRRTTLYRGLRRRTTLSTWKKFFDWCKKNVGKKIERRISKPSSWTSSKEVAIRFADKGGIGGSGVVLSVVAEPKNVLIDVRDTAFDVMEEEVILLPGNYTLKVFKIV